MTRGGAEDVDVENDRIENENATSLAIIEQRAKAMYSLVQAGAGVGAAARIVGFTEDQALELEKSDFVSDDQNPDDPAPDDPAPDDPALEDPATPKEEDDAE